MEKLSAELDTDLGTGYPHDPLSIAFIRSYVRAHGEAPAIARTTWITTQRILEEEIRL